MKMQEIVDKIKSEYSDIILNSKHIPDVKTATKYLEDICNLIIKNGDKGIKFQPGGYAYIAIKMIVDEFKKGTKTEPIHEAQDYVWLLDIAERSANLRIEFEYKL